MNLCTNAFHAMEMTGGTLDIRLEDRELSANDVLHQPNVQPGPFVRLSIGDTGPGIPSAIHSKIFDPYFTTKEVGRGTGMGLAIVHGIVTNAGGFITCDSAPGQGTIFKVYFPVHDQQVFSQPQNGTSLPTGTEHILLVDDEPMLAELGQTLLEWLGYTVTACTNSIEALSVFQKQPEVFHAVITDQTMPGLTGTDFARQLLKIRPDLPIILCTGFSNLVDEEQAKALGIKGFAMKPLTGREIATLLRTVLAT
jgi:CheY-like chemotaxis protein